jgi:hypothetical protein
MNSGKQIHFHSKHSNAFFKNADLATSPKSTYACSVEPPPDADERKKTNRLRIPADQAAAAAAAAAAEAEWTDWRSEISTPSGRRHRTQNALQQCEMGEDRRRRREKRKSEEKGEEKERREGKLEFSWRWKFADADTA